MSYSGSTVLLSRKLDYKLGCFMKIWHIWDMCMYIQGESVIYVHYLCAHRCLQRHGIWNIKTFMDSATHALLWGRYSFNIVCGRCVASTREFQEIFVHNVPWVSIMQRSKELSYTEREIKRKVKHIRFWTYVFLESHDFWESHILLSKTSEQQVSGFLLISLMKNTAFTECQHLGISWFDICWWSWVSFYKGSLVPNLVRDKYHIITWQRGEKVNVLS